MIAISRVTTQYSDVEDRIVLTGEGADGHVYCSWLTQRLANRLLIKLFGILTPAEQDGLSSIVNEFSQEKSKIYFPFFHPLRVCSFVPMHGGFKSLCLCNPAFSSR